MVDDYFNAFTSPNVNGKFEEKTCGEGPSLIAMFEDDKQLHQLINEISVSLSNVFKKFKLECFYTYSRELINELIVR